MKRLLVGVFLIGAGAMFAAAGGGGSSRSFRKIDREIKELEEDLADKQEEIVRYTRAIEGIKKHVLYQSAITLLPSLHARLRDKTISDQEYSETFGNVQKYERILADANKDIEKHQTKIAQIYNDHNYKRLMRKLQLLRVERDAAAARDDGKARVRVSIEEAGAKSEQVFTSDFKLGDKTVKEYINSLLGNLPSENSLQKIHLEDYNLVVSGHQMSWDTKLKDLTLEELQNIRVQRKPSGWDWEAF
ncbi:hypothetical protein EBQ93_00795 [bacterium]|nr:hypothetical protein [bacterium]